MYNKFIQAIYDKNKVKLTFYSKEDSGILVRKCAPMDYGPSRKSYDKRNRYHLWDYESDSDWHPLSLPEEQIIDIEPLDESFDPAEFVDWDLIERPWFTKRDWGQYS